MNQKRRNGSRAIAAFLLFSIAQIGLQIGFAEPSDTTKIAAAPQQVIARLTTRNNQPITVSGLSATTGATILTGATIETTADTSATVNLGPLGTLDIDPNTKLILTYDDDGNVKALIIFGCAVLTAKEKTKGEVATEDGKSNKNDPAAGGVLKLCAGAAGVAQTTGEAGGLFGLGRAATIAIFAGIGAAATTPLFFQDNPSGATP